MNIIRAALRKTGAPSGPPPLGVSFNYASGAFFVELTVTPPGTCPLTSNVQASVNGSSELNSYSNSGNVVRPTITGGAAPFSYLWTKVSGSGNVTAGASTLTPTVTFFDVPNGGLATGVYRLQVTDSASQVATADVELQGGYTCFVES